ncbi:MAG: hypothetical protein M1813_000275 [Trichoglossum hirsutum]|nr:MAG: hypothetical protein M1813_000275 [Trichoglossum hirsutum]
MSSSAATATDRQQLIRATRREIAAKVRDDWEWPPAVIPVPPPPPLLPKRHKKYLKSRSSGQVHRSDGEEAVAGGGDGEGEDGDTSTTTSDEEEEPPLPPPLLTHPAPTAWLARTLDSSPSPSPPSSPPASPYRYEHPDSVGPSIAAQERTLRSKRRRLLEEEMRWNDGLRCWVARRDAWSGARTVEVDGGGSGEEGRGGGGDATKTPPESPTLLPLSPPLHPLHPPPGHLPPHTHPQIYSRVVVKSQTPSMPINLKDLTAALVQGWKDDDMWPPRPAPVVNGTGASGRGLSVGGRRIVGSSTGATVT